MRRAYAAVLARLLDGIEATDIAIRNIRAMNADAGAGDRGTSARARRLQRQLSSPQIIAILFDVVISRPSSSAGMGTGKDAETSTITGTTSTTSATGELLTMVNAFQGKVLQNSTQASLFKSTLLAKVQENLADAKITIDIDTAAFAAFDVAKVTTVPNADLASRNVVASTTAPANASATRNGRTDVQMIVAIACCCLLGACATVLVIRRRCKREREANALRAARISAPKSLYAVRSASTPGSMGHGGVADEDLNSQCHPLPQRVGAGAMHVHGGGTRTEVKSQGRVLI